MKKILGAATAALLTATVLAGCGGSSSSAGSYCGDLKVASTQLKGLGASSLAGDNFAAVITAVHKVAGEAPSDIKPSWTLISNEFDALQSAVTSAGLSMSDFGQLASGQTPANVDPAKLAALDKTLQGMNTSGLSAASDKIAAEVKKECSIDLNS